MEFAATLDESQIFTDVVESQSSKDDITGDEVPSTTNDSFVEDTSIIKNEMQEYVSDENQDLLRKPLSIHIDPILDKLNLVLNSFFSYDNPKSRQNSVSEGSKEVDDVNSTFAPFAFTDMVKDEWKELFGKKNLRNRFLQELDHRRSASAQLDPQRYRSMSIAMDVSLLFSFGLNSAWLMFDYFI